MYARHRVMLIYNWNLKSLFSIKKEFQTEIKCNLLYIFGIYCLVMWLEY